MMKIRRIFAYLLVFVAVFNLSYGAQAAQSEKTMMSPSGKTEEAGGNSPAGKAESGMTEFERQIVETGFRLMPYDHPFVIAYEKTYGIKLDCFKTTINGVTLSGIPFEFGGKYAALDFSGHWWERTYVKEYPVGGLDCAGFINWIYAQLGIEVPLSSTGLFFSGKQGVERRISGIRPHYVLESLDSAMIGDIAYNSQNYSYSSGHGSHTQLYLGTADKLGISQELKKIYPDFPCGAHLVLDCGWSDGDYYYNLMKKIKVPSPRRGMAGVGIQFFTSIKSGSKYIYKSPQKVYKWKNEETGNTFKIESRLEQNGRLLQYKPSRKAEYPINISRPIDRPDV